MAEPAFNFGSFDYFCRQVALPVCTLVGPKPRVEAVCYARNVDFGGFLIFQPGLFMLIIATMGMLIIALVMTVIMITNVRFKYTAIGHFC